MPECDEVVYDVGDEALLTATFKNVDGDNVDPTTVAAYSKSPSGVEAAITPVTNTAVGVYQVTLAVTEHGRWYYKFVGTGTNAAAQEDWIRVKQPSISLP